MNFVTRNHHSLLLITTNVGSLFGEKNGIIREYWVEQITKEVERKRPAFLALHVQESGGKNYKMHSKEMPGLVDELRQKLESFGFVMSRCFLDIQHEILEEFTALSTLCFLHASLVGLVWQYNFRQHKFVSLADIHSSSASADDDALINGGRNHLLLTGGLVRSGFVRKEKFSRDFWPNFRFSRKGFLHTRWKIDNSIFDFINIHLFHDESNLNFVENPLQYSNNRRNALNYVLHKFEKFNGGTIEGNSMLFVFGDFNFRLDLATLVKKLTKQTSEREIVLNSSQQPRNVGYQSESGARLSDSGNASSLGEESPVEDCGTAAAAAIIPSAPHRSLSIDPSASGSETDDFRTSSYDELDDGDFASAHGNDLAAFSSMRRKNSVIEYYRPAVREFLSPSDGPDGNISWVLRIGRKRFEYVDPDWLLREWRVYKEDDCEPRQIPLHELRLEFPPTYPWSEEPDQHKHLMNTRAPAWCDRILFNENALKQVFLEQRHDDGKGDGSHQSSSYCAFGMENCIGDHKPVLLHFTVPPVD